MAPEKREALARVAAISCLIGCLVVSLLTLVLLAFRRPAF